MSLRWRPMLGEHRGKMQPEDSQMDGGAFGQMKEAVKGLGPAEGKCWHPGTLRDTNTGSLPRLPVHHTPGHWAKLEAPPWLCSSPTRVPCQPSQQQRFPMASCREEGEDWCLINSSTSCKGEGEPAGIPAGNSRRLRSLVEGRNQ